MPNVRLSRALVQLIAAFVFAGATGLLVPVCHGQAGRPTGNSQKTKAVVYTNKKYRFRFSLPETWIGYSISVTQWEGGDGRTYEANEKMPTPEKGPLIVIGDPRSSKENPRQCIPIMVFTKRQWQLVEGGSLILSAAPVGPGELGRNNKYVFALPARFNYALLDGWEEVNRIISSHPLQVF
jgi:hypothetical protein